MHVSRLLTLLAVLVGSYCAWATPPMKAHFAIEIDAVDLRYRLVAAVAGKDVRYDSCQLRVIAGVPAGATLSIRDRDGNVVLAGYTPLMYASVRAEPPSYREVHSPGPVSEWYRIAALFRRSTENQSARQTAEWRELKIDLAVNPGQTAQSTWCRIEPGALKRFLAEP